MSLVRGGGDRANTEATAAQRALGSLSSGDIAVREVWASGVVRSTSYDPTEDGLRYQ